MTDPNAKAAISCAAFFVAILLAAGALIALLVIALAVWP